MKFQAWPRLQEFLPKHTRSELRELKNNIGQYGVLENGVALKDGRILDGFHRHNFSSEMEFTIVDLEDEEALALGIALNVAKRNLSFEQLKTLREALKQDRELRKKTALELRNQGKTQEETAAIIGTDQRTIGRWEEKNDESIRQMPNTFIPETPDCRILISKSEHEIIYQRHLNGETQKAISEDYKVTSQRIGQIIKKVKEELEQSEPVDTPEFPEKQYRCIVVDPPWPMKKSERTERPEQGKYLDYKTLTLEEIGELPIQDRVNPDGCHIYLWTTQRFLPDAFDILEKWGVEYHCTLTWVKPTGMTPFSWMFNTEFVLFGWIGTFKVEKMGIKTSFQAKGREHSRKPDVFYDRIKEVSPGPRLNMYSREERDGFESWGLEVNKFE